MDPSRLTSKIFWWDWAHRGKTWSWRIRQIFKDTKQEPIVNPNDMTINIDSNTMLDKAKEELLLTEVDKWKKELQGQPKLRFYRTFKDIFIAEKYVKVCSTKTNRSFISQLRSGVLPLKVEVGRFSQLPLNKRLCDNCKTVIEDENHFIFTCPLYDNLRHEYFTYVTQYHDIQRMTHGEKLKLFMTDERLINKFGSFIRNCFYKRNDVIYSVS
jgi:hypothetical protein